MPMGDPSNGTPVINTLPLFRTQVINLNFNRGLSHHINNHISNDISSLDNRFLNRTAVKEQFGLIQSP